MDLEYIKRLNTPHFCRWYLKRLQAILDKEKKLDYSRMPCESFTDLSRIIEHSQFQGKWDQRARKWVLTNPLIYCHARIGGTIDDYETRELTEYFIESSGFGIMPFFPNYIKEYKAPDDARLHDYFFALKPVLSVDNFNSIMQRLNAGGTRKSIARYMHVDLGVSSDVKAFVLDNFEPPYYAFDMDQWDDDGFLCSGYDGKCLILPNKDLRKKVLTPPVESVECSTVETKQEGNKMMSTIKETAIKSKDQVVKTAIGQAGVAGIKSLILTALPMQIGFIGRLLGRHKQAANNSLVVAGVAILANQIGQKYLSNETAKNALQATQDQALSEVLNEYVGIENQVAKVVTNSLQLDAQPVTVDQD